jgi:putative oxidoreductase
LVPSRTQQKSVQRQRTGTAKDKGSERGAIPLRLIVGFGFMGARLREDCARTGEVSIDPACAGRACFRPVGLGGNSRRVVRRLAVFLGAFIPLASIPLAIVLLVAIFTVHVPNGFSSIKLLSVDAVGAYFGQPGFETALEAE